MVFSFYFSFTYFSCDFRRLNFTLNVLGNFDFYLYFFSCNRNTFAEEISFGMHGKYVLFRRKVANDLRGGKFTSTSSTKKIKSENWLHSLALHVRSIIDNINSLARTHTLAHTGRIIILSSVALWQFEPWENIFRSRSVFIPLVTLSLRRLCRTTWTWEHCFCSLCY